MDVSAYGVKELEDAELIRIDGGCELFCAMLKEAGKAYQNTKEAIGSALEYIQSSDTGTPSYYTY